MDFDLCDCFEIEKTTTLFLHRLFHFAKIQKSLTPVLSQNKYGIRNFDCINSELITSGHSWQINGVSMITLR